MKWILTDDNTVEVKLCKSEAYRHSPVISNPVMTLLTSLTKTPSGSVCDLHCEVLPESDTSLSVTFHLPDSGALAVCKYLCCVE